MIIFEREKITNLNKKEKGTFLKLALIPFGY
jgi:hypothetical protein